MTKLSEMQQGCDLTAGSLLIMKCFILFVLVYNKVFALEYNEDPAGWNSFFSRESHEHADEVDVVDPGGWNNWNDLRIKDTMSPMSKNEFLSSNNDGEMGILKTNTVIERKVDIAVKSKVESLFNKASNVNENLAFVKRFVSIVLNAADLTDKLIEKEQDVSGIIEVKMPVEQLMTLKRFCNSELNISMRELDTILSASIQPKYVPDVSESIEKFFFLATQKDVWLPCILILFMFCMIRFLHTRKTLGSFAMTVVLLILIASFFIEYYRMYKEVQIRQKVILDKDIPESCKADRSLWTAILSSFSFFNDDCEQYHKAVWMDPLIEVSPANALSNVLSDIVLNPFGKIGTAISKFSSSIMGELPFPVNYIVWIVASLGTFSVIVLVLLTLIGNSVQFNTLFTCFTTSRSQATEMREPPKNSAVTATTPSQPSASLPILEGISGVKNFVLMDTNSFSSLMQRGQSGVALHHSGVQELTTPPETAVPDKSCSENLTDIEEKISQPVGKSDKSALNKESTFSNSEGKKIIQDLKDINPNVEEKCELKSLEKSITPEELLGTYEIIQPNMTDSKLDTTFIANDEMCKDVKCAKST